MQIFSTVKNKIKSNRIKTKEYVERKRGREEERKRGGEEVRR